MERPGQGAGDTAAGAGTLEQELREAEGGLPLQPRRR